MKSPKKPGLKIVKWLLKELIYESAFNNKMRQSRHKNTQNCSKLEFSPALNQLTSKKLFAQDTRGEFGGGRGGRSPLISGIWPTADPKSAPFLDIHFWLTDTKVFLKALLAQMYTKG